MQLIANKFTSFEFTAQELQQVTNYTDLQRAFLQSELAAKAQTRLALTFDPVNPTSFIQEEAYLKGQMELLESLLLPVDNIPDEAA